MTPENKNDPRPDAARIEAEIADSFDEEFELEWDDERLDRLMTAGTRMTYGRASVALYPDKGEGAAEAMLLQLAGGASHTALVRLLLGNLLDTPPADAQVQALAASLLDSGQQQRDQNRNNRDHDQQFDQCEAAAMMT